ncbi:hypothetical protein [Methylobacterium sp. ID0610]|uniref:hypothetical protein n=1 Tax=Methylobacterium carpenticola TaxID=3344827 RepID=UPI0036B4A676
MPLNLAETLLAEGIAPSPDLSHQVRKLGFFREGFFSYADAIAGRLGLSVVVDPVLLTRAFLDWRDEFLGQSRVADINRRDYMIFSSALMLYNLVRHRPASLDLQHQGHVLASAGEVKRLEVFWPEGLLYTGYCLTTLDTVLAQEGEEPIHLSPLIAETATWWSFRENVLEDPTRAIGFLDLFVGAEPNWDMPCLAADRPAIRGLARRIRH